MDAILKEYFRYRKEYKGIKPALAWSWALNSVNNGGYYYE